MVPSAFVFVQRLPLTPNGKIDRVALAKLEIDIPTKNSNANPTDRMEFELTHLLKKCLRIARVSRHDNFFDLGGDSLRAVSLIAQIEKRFGKTVRLVDFLADPTVQGVACLLRQSGCATQWSFLFPIQPCGPRPPFFWIHGDGSNFLLPAYLGEDQPLYGFMHQSQDGRPAQYTTVEEIATHYLQELCSVQPEGPYFLGGYSFGGLVAFEMAQQLRARGEKITLLALLEPTSPGTIRPDAFKGQKTAAPLTEHARRIRRQLGKLQALSTPEKIAYFAARGGGFVERLSGIPKLKRAGKRAVYRWCERSGRSIPSWARTAYLMNLYTQAARRYVSDAHPGRVVFFKGVNNAHNDRTAWRTLVTGELNFHEVPGDHASVIEEPQLQIWAERLNDSLKKAQMPQAAEVSKQGFWK